ncbi:MAG: sodium/proton-translocating pyrophosphatase, partial [Gemmatimonadaceae bacterium]
MLDNLTLYALVIGVVGLVACYVTYLGIARQSPGSQVMQDLAEQIQLGAMAFLKREYAVLLPFLLVVAGLLSWAINMETGIAYVLGGVCSVAAGWAGMTAATKANVRTSEAARASGQAAALRIAFGGGAVMGLAVAALGLLGIAVIFVWQKELLGTTGFKAFGEIISGFAMGASSIALFARVGGGIYTKAADVGADLVGKVEAGIPEDDPRNPATIADNDGDNVGDVAGMGADLYESYYGSILSTMALGAAAAFTLGLPAGEAAQLAMLLAVAPLALAGLGIIASIAGIFAVRTTENATFSELLAALHRGVYVASGLIFVGCFALLFFLLGESNFVQSGEVFRWWGIGVAIVSGLVAGLVIA